MTRRRNPVSEFYISDADVAAKLGMNTSEWTATAKALERYGLPMRDPLFNNRRCWPAVSEFLIRRAIGDNGPSENGEVDGFVGFGVTIPRSKKTG